MRLQVKISLLLIICSVLLANNSNAQITSSPYSIFGMGNIEENSLGGNKGMGGTGIVWKFYKFSLSCLIQWT